MVRDRLSRLVRGIARRVVRGSPRIPHAEPTDRARPTNRTEWKPPPEPEPELELSAADVLRRIGEGEPVVLVDVREAHELWSGHARDAILAPMSQFQQLASSLPDGPLLAIYCAAGARSYGIADYLRQNGRPNAWSIPEGFGGFIDAGGAWLQPATGVSWKLLQPVRVTEACARRHGVEHDRAGQVQAVEQADAGLVLTVRTRGGTWLAGLQASDVEPIGRG